MTAPLNWNQEDTISQFQLPSGENVSCVLWNELFHISGTDIVRALAYRFECMGRVVTFQKKFEEGIFSDLRNLKPLSDASLEDSRSPFLKFLYEHSAIRTQKRQKVFYWFSVKHDKLFMAALERDLKREAQGQVSTTTLRELVGANKGMELSKSYHAAPMAIQNDGRGALYNEFEMMYSAESIQRFGTPPIQRFASPIQHFIPPPVQRYSTPPIQRYDSPSLDLYGTPPSELFQENVKQEMYNEAPKQDLHMLANVMNTPPLQFLDTPQKATEPSLFAMQTFNADYFNGYNNVQDSRSEFDDFSSQYSGQNSTSLQFH